MARHHHHPILTLAALLIVLALIGVLGYIAYNILFAQTPLPQVAIVAGSVKTTGLSTYPVAVSFSLGAGRYFTTVASGRYAISLPIHQTYNTTISWKALAGFGSGICSAGQLSLITNATLVSYNATC